MGQELPHQFGEQDLGVGSEEAFKRQGFEDMYRRFLLAEFPREPEDGSVTTVQAYELIIDPSDQTERRGMLINFGLRAASLGYREAFPSVSLSHVGYRDSNGERPLTAFYFFLTPPDSAT